MAADAAMIEEVVVTALGIKRSEKSLGYSVQAIEGNDLMKTQSTNLVSNLAGNIAGVQVISGAGSSLGGSAKIRIRGVNGLSSGDPLFVVDGTPISNANFSASAEGSDFGNLAADINPEDVEKISVLKGPSATALYGSRGANGVILITTKKGKYNQKTRFEFSTETGVQDRAFDKMTLMNADEYIRYGGILMWNSQTQLGTTFTNLKEATDFYMQNYEPDYDGSQNTDWVKAVTRTSSVVNTYNFGVSGGGSNTSYRIGGSYYNNTPLVKTSGFDRLSINTAIDHKASDKLKFGLNLKSKIREVASKIELPLQ